MAKKAMKKAAKKADKKAGRQPQRKAAKKAAKKTARKTPRKAAKRSAIDTGTDKRYVRRAPTGTFTESDDVGMSLAADRRKKAKAKVRRGQGDKGDR